MLVEKNIPYLRSDQNWIDVRQGLVLDHIRAAALSVVWRMHRVWAVSFPMSEGDCKASSIVASKRRGTWVLC